MKDKGYAYQTISNYKRSLNASFRIAIADDLVRKNPFDFKLNEVIEDDRTPRQTLTEEQEEKLLSFASKDRTYSKLVLCQEKVQIKCNQFSIFLAKLNLLFLSHSLPNFSDILPHIDWEINIHNGCEYVLYCKMFLCIQKSTYMHVHN